MAASISSLSFSLDAIFSSNRPSLPSSSSKPSHLFLSIHQSIANFNLKSLLPSPPSTPPSPTNENSRVYEGVIDSDDLQDDKLYLENFCYAHHFDDDRSLVIRLLAPEDVDNTARLLSESFSETLLTKLRYNPEVLEFMLKQHLLEKRALIPHAATLVAFYRMNDEVEEDQFVGTAEVLFDASRANTSPPTPIPPNDSPYICNLAVKKEHRRKGIGRNLLKACEELISEISAKKEAYLHVRKIDTGAFKMYINAGYKIIKTDSILLWLRFQRRKYLMYKKLT